MLLEIRQLSWRGRTWRAVCERISGSHFVCDGPGSFDREQPPLDLDPGAASDLAVDGVPCRSFSVGGDDALHIELTAALPSIKFTPHREFPPRVGDISYEDALARASVKYPVNAAEIRETATYWVFPVFQIGCCGILVEKATGDVVDVGSYTSIDDWIWGYDQGLLDEPARDLVVLAVRNAEIALQALKQFIAHPRIEELPVTFVGCAEWRAILPLRKAGDALTWRCEARQ